MKETVKKVITEVFNKNFTNIDDFDHSDVADWMTIDIVKMLELDIEDLHINKLTKAQKEDISGLDYNSTITCNMLERHYEDETIHYIILDILFQLANKKSISRKITKWFVD